MKILVAEDELRLAEYMAGGLRQAGHVVELSHNGTDAMNRAGTESFDLILLDLMMPGSNGLEVLRNLRAFHIDTPVMIVSALSETKQVVEGLDLGAVDYIRKPFEWDELLARIRTVHRKTTGAETVKIQIANLCIDLITRKVTRDDKEIALTAREFILLEYLARQANRILSRNQILEQVWEMDFDPESNIVEVYMYQLRKKIDKGFEPALIETFVGSGYRLKGEKIKG